MKIETGTASVTVTSSPAPSSKDDARAKRSALVSKNFLPSSEKTPRPSPPSTSTDQSRPEGNSLLSPFYSAPSDPRTHNSPSGQRFYSWTLRNPVTLEQISGLSCVGVRLPVFPPSATSEAASGQPSK